MTTEAAVVPQEPRPQISTGKQALALIPTNLDELQRLAGLMFASGLMPTSIKSKEAVAVAIMAGAEVGVAPMASVQNIAVINGRPCMWGDLIVGLVQASGLLEYLVEEWDEATGTATARIKRKGFPEHVETFSRLDAKKAKLSEKDTYKLYEKRMHGWKAKTYCIRAEFSDVLKGLGIREDVEDYIDVEATASTKTALPPMPREIGEAPATKDDPTASDPDADPTTERTLEDEIYETGEQLNMTPVEIAAKIKAHEKAGTLDSYRDNLALELKRKGAKG